MKMNLWVGGTVDVPDDHPILEPIEELKAMIHEEETREKYEARRAEAKSDPVSTQYRRGLLRFPDVDERDRSSDEW